MPNYLKSRYWGDPPSYIASKAMTEEVFEMFHEEGKKPEDIKDDALRAHYTSWLKKRGNDTEDA